MAEEAALEPEVRVLQPLQPLCEHRTDLQPADAQLGARRHDVALEELLDVPEHVQRMCSACAVPCVCTACTAHIRRREESSYRVRSAVQCAAVRVTRYAMRCSGPTHGSSSGCPMQPSVLRSPLSAIR
eukprot:scaffold107806_cov75-Phaeocystis_antarctica.AAC.1